MNLSPTLGSALYGLPVSLLYLNCQSAKQARSSATRLLATDHILCPGKQEPWCPFPFLLTSHSQPIRKARGYEQARVPQLLTSPWGLPGLRSLVGSNSVPSPILPSPLKSVLNGKPTVRKSMILFCSRLPQGHLPTWIYRGPSWTARSSGADLVVSTVP